MTEASHRAKVRCFVAVPVGRRIREGAAAVGVSLDRLPVRVSWVPVENMHLTLRFIGEVPVESMDAVLGAVEHAVSDVPSLLLTYEKLGVFPRRGDVRTVWVGVGGAIDVLTQVAERLDEGLSVIGISRERRPFSPHLTIGRVRGRLSSRQWQHSTGHVPPVFLGEDHVESVSCLCSELRRDGPPVYTVLREYPLVGFETGGAA